jgi:hypothetical protein
MAIHNRHDFQDFSAPRGPISARPPLAIEGCVDEALFFGERAFLRSSLAIFATQHFIAAPTLKATMHSFMVRLRPGSR